ncbi:hypothetical protein KJ707_00415 [Patescibacteria group bacterium]|nr:hypothetical protein [Patescibacteria group bacterium]
MMDINFVRNRIKTLTKLAQGDKKIFNIAGVTTAVFLVILVGIFGLRFYLISQLSKIENSKQSLLARIKSQENTEKSFVIFVDKLRVLSGVFAERKDKQDAISYFSQVFGSDVVIDRIAYDASSQFLAFGVMAADVFTLENVFETLASEQSVQKFSSLTKSNLQRNSKGIYQMQITVVLGKETAE